MKILSLETRLLYGVFNYHIDFSSDTGDVSLITAPNGYGKTTLLRILSSLNPNDLFYFYKLKFDAIVVRLEGNNELSIEKVKIENKLYNEGDTASNDESEVRFNWKKNGDVTSFFCYNPSNISKAIHFLRFTDTAFVRDDYEDSKILSSSYLDHNKVFNQQIAHSQGQDQFILMLDNIKTCFLAANRIYISPEDRDKTLPIERVNESIHNLLKQERMRFLTNAQIEDGKFINDALYTTSKAISRNEYEKKVSELSRDKELLEKYGFSTNITLPDYSDDKQNLLSAYIEHLYGKLKYTQDTLQKVYLFEKMLSSKKFVNKTISFSARFGIRATCNDGEFIGLSNLSSGEQNEIIMLYKLIFEVTDKSTLLIDEPENSLHVAWQKRIYDDFVRLAEVKHLQIITATHSPVITACGRANTTDLFYLSKQK